MSSPSIHDQVSDAESNRTEPNGAQPSSAKEKNIQPKPNTSKQVVTVLGATGSIGKSTLDVIARHPDKFSLYALTANSNDQQLAEQCLAHQPSYAVMADHDAADRLQRRLDGIGCVTKVLSGEEGLVQVASADRVDTVMAAIVGAAGLTSTIAAVQAGKKVLLANKESLVMAGHILMAAVSASGATLLPIDSEHNAIFQCLPPQFSQTATGDAPQGLAQWGVRKILLTASGGPFRSMPLEQLSKVTPEQACAHPNWSMGPKISVDSATMMNKGLELIEACWLFGARPDQVDVVVHSQSVIHSLVEYVDGSVLAQLGNPDMRTPIAHALAWPQRIESGVASLDLVQQGRLDFEKPDFDRFPCLRLAMDAASSGGSAPAVLNAANEEAVAAFLNGEIGYNAISGLIERVMATVDPFEPKDITDVQTADREARQLAQRFLPEMI